VWPCASPSPGRCPVGTGKPFVIASGILGVLPPGAVATERDGLAAAAGDSEVRISGANDRMANAHFASALAGRGVRSSVVRLPPATHGNGDNGFMTTAIGFAREKGAAAYVGDGANRWPAVHRDDAAHLFRLAIESAPAGSALHAVGDEGVPIRARCLAATPHRSGTGFQQHALGILGVARPAFSQLPDTAGCPFRRHPAADGHPHQVGGNRGGRPVHVARHVEYRPRVSRTGVEAQVAADGHDPSLHRAHDVSLLPARVRSLLGVRAHVYQTPGYPGAVGPAGMRHSVITWPPGWRGRPPARIRSRSSGTAAGR